MALQPAIGKMEEYLTEIAVPQNVIAAQYGVSYAFTDLKSFQSGTLSKNPEGTYIAGTFSPGNCKLFVQFVLPEEIESNTLTMKPFRVELLGKDHIVLGFKKDLQFTELDIGIIPAHYRYTSIIDLSAIWKDNVDLIRITWNIHVQQLDLSNEQEVLKERSQFIDLKREMTSFHNSQDLSDATIRCGSEVILVHRCILALASPVFRKMFTTEMKEKKDGDVFIEDVDANIVKLLVKWIYAREIEVLDLQDKLDLFKAAHRYQIESLKDWCISQICGAISSENVLAIYALGESYEEILIQRKSLEIMKANKDKIFLDEDSSKEFAQRYPLVMLELVKG